MLFNSRRFRITFGCIYYAALFLAAVVLLLVNSFVHISGEAAETLSWVLVFLAMMSLHFLHFATKELLNRDRAFGRILGFVFDVIAHVVTIFGVMFVFLMAASNSDTGKASAFMYGSILALVVSTATYCLYDVWDAKNKLNTCYFLIFLALPVCVGLGYIVNIIPFPLGCGNVVLSVIIMLAFYIFIGYGQWRIFHFVMSILLSLASLVSVLSQLTEFDWSEPVNVFAFTPCLTILFLVVVFVCIVKLRVSEMWLLSREYLGIFAVAGLVMPVVQYLIGTIWYVGLVVYALLLVGIVIANVVFSKSDGPLRY